MIYKFMTTILLTVCFYSSVVAQERENREVYGYVGPVRSVRVETAKLSKQSGKNVEKGRRLFEDISFDVNGNMTEEIGYDDKGSVEQKWIYKHNEMGHLTEVSEYGADGSLKNKAVYTYNAKQNNTERCEYNSNNELEAKTIFSYDARGNTTEIAFYDDKGKLVDKTIYTYDENGRKTKSIHRAGTRTESQVIHTYDNEGDLIHESYKSPLFRKAVYIKDANGSDIVEYYDRSGEVTMKVKYIYENDSVGNWIKEIKLKWSRWAGKNDESEYELEEVTYRTIIYY